MFFSLLHIFKDKPQNHKLIEPLKKILQKNSFYKWNKKPLKKKTYLKLRNKFINIVCREALCMHIARMCTINFLTLCLIHVQRVIQNWRFTHIGDTVACIISTIYKTYIFGTTLHSQMNKTVRMR